MKNFPTAETFHGSLVWETPWIGLLFLALAGGLVVFTARRLRSRGFAPRRVLVLSLLRLLPVLILALLLARPMRVFSHDEGQPRSVVLLVDRSESMSFEDVGDKSRYSGAVDFARSVVLPGLQQAGYRLQPMLFASGAEKADGPAIVNAVPDGKTTDLGGAIDSGLHATPHLPYAVVALTDGASNQPQSNRSAIGALLAGKVPFIGVGFGSEHGVQTLNLREVEGPRIAPPNSRFRLSARLEATVRGTLPSFNLVLLRDGKFLEKRAVSPVSTSRFWSESFEVAEAEEGMHTYHVQIEPPAVEGLVVVNDGASASVRITKEDELRVLYMQGALTWDYKFIGRALRNDPTAHVTGLSRTSEHSVFRQNVEAAGELINGFPEDVRELAPYRVVILANLKPSDLNPAQQEAIARFCSDYGGGVLMIGGRTTFDASWRGSRLEQLLPVKFEEDRGVRGLDEPFQFKLTAEALNDPVFDLDETIRPREAWEKLPPFDDYGRVAEAKPGAVVWAVHGKDVGGDGKPRILMAAQPYGMGTTAVIAVQNFWKWRLAKDCDQKQFDRFWQQFIRRLAESGRGAVRVEVLDQELSPGRDIAMTVEKLPDASGSPAPGGLRCRFAVYDSAGGVAFERPLTLEPAQVQPVSFTPQKPDIYRVEVTDEAGAQLASRPLEIRAPNPELQAPARDMETLKQWAVFSGGSAWTVEAALADPAQFTRAILDQIEATRAARIRRVPLGVNPWTFALVLLPLCAGWIWRKKWMLN